MQKRKEVGKIAKTSLKEPIPQFKNYQEEAEFWDSHSLADYQDELERVKVRFAQHLSVPLTIRVDQKTLDKLRQKAHKKGVGPTTLARMWIMEHIAG